MFFSSFNTIETVIFGLSEGAGGPPKESAEMLRSALPFLWGEAVGEERDARCMNLLLLQATIDYFNKFLHGAGLGVGGGECGAY